MKYCLGGFLGECQRKTVFRFLDICEKLLAEKLERTKVPLLVEEVNTVLAELERYMPVTIQVYAYIMCPFIMVIINLNSKWYLLEYACKMLGE